MKLARQYFMKHPSGPEHDRCFIMTASIVGFVDSPGIPQYTASKWDAGDWWGVFGERQSLMECVQTSSTHGKSHVYSRTVCKLSGNWYVFKGTLPLRYWVRRFKHTVRVRALFLRMLLRWLKLLLIRRWMVAILFLFPTAPFVRHCFTRYSSQGLFWYRQGWLWGRWCAGEAAGYYATYLTSTAGEAWRSIRSVGLDLSIFTVFFLRDRW